jgi:hypothetical protein
MMLLALLFVLGVAPVAVAAPASDEIVLSGPEQPVGLAEWFEITVSGPFGEDARIVATVQDPDVILGPVSTTARGAHTILTQAVCVAREGRRTIEGLELDTGDARQPLPALDVEVVFDLPGGRKARVAERLPPLDLPLPREARGPWVLLALLAALLALGVFVVRTGRVIEVVVPPRPADLVAIDALARLRLRQPQVPEEIRPFVVSVSGVLRTYIEGRFGLHAPALTTEEFLIQAGIRHDAVAERREVLEDFLTRCDLVKFARVRPERAVIAAMLDTAERFVEETRAPDEVPRGETPEADAAPVGAAA